MTAVTQPENSAIINKKAFEDLAKESGKSINFIIERQQRVNKFTVMSDEKQLDKIDGRIILLVPDKELSASKVAALAGEEESGKIIKKTKLGEEMMVVPALGSLSFELIENYKSFKDTERHWAKSGIEFISSRELMLGTGDAKFSPDAPLTRGMLVTILGRLSEIKANDYQKSEFPDVNSKKYYSSYVEWAYSQDIVKGYSEGTFAPEKPITREQLATIIYRYLSSENSEYIGIKGNPKQFSDSHLISSYAAEAVRFLHTQGIISGKSGNRFDPKGFATRAELCAVFERLIQKM